MVTKIIRINHTLREPTVKLYDRRFVFNAAFRRLAELEGKHFVEYSIDESKKEVYFEFFELSTDDSFKLEGIETNKRRSTAAYLIKNYPWIGASVSHTFNARKQGDYWVITLNIDNAVSKIK